MSRTAMLAYLAETVHHARPAGGFDHKRECGHARLTKIDIRVASAKIDLSDVSRARTCNTRNNSATMFNPMYGPSGLPQERRDDAGE